MTALQIMGLVLLILICLLQIRAGVEAEYHTDGPVIRICFGGIKFQAFPKPAPQTKHKKSTGRPKKAPKTEKKAEKKDTPPAVKKSMGEKINGGLEYAMELLPLVLEAGGQFKRKLQIDVLRLRLTAGGPDPGDAVMLYGRANAALGALWYPLNQCFLIRDGSAKTELDFNAERTTLEAQARLSMKLGQILWLGIYFGCKGMARFLSVRRKQQKQSVQGKAV